MSFTRLSFTRLSFTRGAAIAATLSAIALAAASNLSYAHDYKIGDLEIAHPWTRATAPGAKVGAGYLKITNKGAQPDRLMSASFAASNATEVHEMKHEGGVMQMRELKQGIVIKAGETVEFKPGGFHLMFIDLKAGLKEKDRMKGELVFEKAGRVEVEFAVEAMGARGGGHQHHNHGHKTQ